jgi:2-(1,2-epoxy-1,2-dihydrophenyl)acetyl-CoA isomerase
MARPDVLVSDDGAARVAVVTINRPPDNYFDTALISSLADAYEALEHEGRCRAIVLRSEGKHFCAGAALGRPAMESPGALYGEALRLFAAGLPVVAAVQGAAIGGGLGLALSADFRVGAPESRWSANFARLGFHHGFGLTVTLPAVAGPQQAMRMLLTGARLNGEEAHRIGLLDRLVDLAGMEAAARQLAAEIAASAPLAVASIRRTMRAGLVDRVRAATEHERAEQDRLISTRDFAEGVRATAERRAPEFEGR